MEELGGEGWKTMVLNPLGPGQRSSRESGTVAQRQDQAQTGQGDFDGFVFANASTGCLGRNYGRSHRAMGSNPFLRGECQFHPGLKVGEDRGCL